jgi:hypothetical protein
MIEEIIKTEDSIRTVLTTLTVHAEISQTTAEAVTSTTEEAVISTTTVLAITNLIS